jgi:hypothetical protein
MIVPFALLALAQSFDFFTFTIMFARHGAAAELNPLIARLASDYGVGVLAMAKIGLVVTVASIVAIIMAKRPRLAGAVLVIGIGAGLLGGVSNIASV